jgi:hypothetical protein
LLLKDEKILFKEFNSHEDVIYFYEEILLKKFKKIIVDLKPTIITLMNDTPKNTIPLCINLFISSIFMIISAILLFFCRKYRKNWKLDMLTFYLMESFSNTSIITIPFFSILLNINIKYYLFGENNILHVAGLVFSFISIIFKLYLIYLSFSDYFEFEEYIINKKKKKEE